MKTKKIKQTIKEYFFTNPNAKLRVREIERKLKLPLPSVIRYCKELKKESILDITKIGNVTFYTANKSGEEYMLEKKLYNIKKLYDSGTIDYLKEEWSNPTIIVFGSFANGQDIEESDIDLYIETPSNKKVNLDKFKNILNREIQIFKHRSIKEIKNSDLANNIINGVLLNGYLEVL